jgi:hypothetical protein
LQPLHSCAMALEARTKVAATARIDWCVMWVSQLLLRN